MIKSIIKLLLPEFLKALLLFLITYSIPLVCLLLFEKDSANLAIWINTLGVTTIAYCASIIFKHLFEHKQGYIIAVIVTFLLMLILYCLLYAKCMSAEINYIWFWASTALILVVSLVLDLCSAGYEIRVYNPKKIAIILSA